ncbi:MAG: Gldg family protein [Alphaproteobacteria bacterium]|nr:Gldg family protein [Alphaproteobacteria bacterium]
MAAGTRSKRGLISLGGLLLVAILFVAVNVAGNVLLSGTRIDLTQDRLFTLSPGTRQVLSQLQEPITLRFYFSDRLGREIPSYGVYATRVREMLQEYRSAAAGKVRLEIIDPQPFTDEEDRAVSFGLQGVPVNQAGELVYFGLAGSNSADKEETVPFFQPERERFLEYDLTRLVYNLANIRKPVLGVISTLPLWGEFRGMRQQPQPWAVTQQLDQFFTVRRLEMTATEIPADVNVLMLVHPRDLPEPLQYAVDQFVLRGGRALVFVDPHSEYEAARGGMQAAANTGSNLPALLQAWGVEMVENRIAADRQAAMRVAAGGESRVRAVDYVAWLQLRAANFNTSDVLTADLGSIRLATAGILRTRDGATTTVAPLMQTGPVSMELDADQVRMMPDPVAILSRFQPANQRLLLAARITGPARSAFPNGPPAAPAAPAQPAQGDGQPAATPPAPAAPAAAPATPPAAHLAEARAPINVIVVADSDILDDRFWVQAQEFFGQRVFTPTANNGDFVVNAVDNLAGSDGLISLRARGQSARPFTLVQEIQGEAETRFRATERQLTERLRETEQRLAQIRTQGTAEPGQQGGGTASGSRILSREQQEAIDQFRAQVLTIRRELRDVQQQLRQNINSLEALVKFVNIGLLPIVIALVAVIVGIVKTRRRRRGTRFTHGHRGAAA